ncbi:MAG: hypothetical protein Q9221_004024 [Calogaya cf. arnoldii]
MATKLNESVTVRVGTGEAMQTWTIQKKLLTHHSTFFAAALNGFFTEATTNTIKLDKDNPQAFQVFVQWLYTGRFVVYSYRECDQDIAFKCCGPEANFLCAVWALGDKFNCHAFQDHAMLQFLVLHMDTYLQLDVLADAYKLSSSGSKLRQFVVDEFIHETLDGRGKENIERLSLEDFNRDALTRMVEMQGAFLPTHKDGNRYLLLLDWDIHGKQYLDD